MIQLKIYDKDRTPLTAFNLGEYGALNYRKTVGQIGDCSFTLNIDNAKVTQANVRNYNRIEIISDGVIEWNGYIISKRVTLNTLSIQCKELVGILGKRIVTDGYTLSGEAGTAVGTLLSTINGGEDTGIIMGETDVTDTINMTFNQQDAFSILQNIASTVGAQFVLNDDRTLDFKNTIGADKTTGDDKVRLEYNVLQPQQANLLKFEVEDNGENITTKAYGKSDALTSLQDDSGLLALYGTLEKFFSFTQANTQENLDALTASKLTDSLFSPTLSLIPNEPDNFDIGDLVLVSIKNKLINIDDSFQVLEKSVKIVNSQKSITVRINQLPQDVVDEISALQKSVNQLETNS